MTASIIDCVPERLKFLNSIHYSMPSVVLSFFSPEYFLDIKRTCFTLSTSPQCIHNHVWCFPTNLKQLFKLVCPILSFVKGIVHPKMTILCFSANPQGIRYVCDFVSSVEHKRKFLTQTVADCQSYNVTQWYLWLWEKKQTYTDQTKWNPAARDDTLRSKDTKRSCKKQNSIYIIILCAL